MKTKHFGSCLCQAVRFEVEGEFESFFLCHCSRCRKDSGSAHAANLFSKTARLIWLSGEELVCTFNLPETQHMKSFCSTCGSAMPNLQMDGRLLMVPAGSLDSDFSTPSPAHIFLSDKARWDENLHHVPRYEEFPRKP